MVGSNCLKGRDSPSVIIYCVRRVLDGWKKDFGSGPLIYDSGFWNFLFGSWIIRFKFCMKEDFGMRRPLDF